MNFTQAFRGAAVLLIFTCLSFAVRAQTTSGNSQQLVDELTQKMALKYQLSETPENIRTQFEQNPLQLPASTNEQMLQQYDEAYATDLLLKDFKSIFRQKLTDQYQNEISQWLSSEDTRPITDARQFYYTTQGKRQRVITRYKMDQNPPSEQRINLISTLTDTTSLAESSVESSIIVVRSLIQAIGQISTQYNFGEAQINGIANNFRAQFQSQTGSELNRQQLVMYRSVSDETLQSYIAFWGTNTGQWLDETISQSLQAAYQKAADRFLQSVNN